MSFKAFRKKHILLHQCEHTTVVSISYAKQKVFLRFLQPGLELLPPTALGTETGEMSRYLNDQLMTDNARTSYPASHLVLTVAAQREY
jgi:hypothetical protein